MLVVLLGLCAWAEGPETAAKAGADASANLLPEAPQPQPAPVAPGLGFFSAGAPDGYAPLSTGDKFGIFLRQTYSPYTFLGVTFDAGFAQLTNDWPGYGGGMSGFGKRYGALLADREAQTFFSTFLFASALRQDPRYFRMGEGHSVWRRAAYAATRVAVTRSDSGRSTPNSSLWMGTLLARSLTNAYYPSEDRGFSDTMSRVGGSLLSTAQTNITREFLPDLIKVFHKHEPERVKEWEDKMPSSFSQMLGSQNPTVNPPHPGK